MRCSCYKLSFGLDALWHAKRWRQSSRDRNVSFDSCR